MAEYLGRMRLQEEQALSVATPWDLKRGRVVAGEHDFDVLAPRASQRLAKILEAASITHWANECKSFSKARGKPIPWLPEGEGPRPLRNARHPQGLPGKLAGKGADAQLLQSANAMAELTAQACTEAWKSDRYFVVENPDGSWLWSLPCMKELTKLTGVVRVLFINCAFGGTRRKWTALLTNVPELIEECTRPCHAAGRGDPCDYTGVPHEGWEPTVADGRITATHGAGGGCQSLCAAPRSRPARRTLSHVRLLGGLLWAQRAADHRGGAGTGAVEEEEVAGPRGGRCGGESSNRGDGRRGPTV